MTTGFKPGPVFRFGLSRLLSLCKSGIQKFRLPGFIRTRTFALIFYVCISLIIIAVAAFNIKTVQVVDGSGSKTVYTFRSSPTAILRQCGITLSPEDRMEFTDFKHNYARINLFEAFPVEVTADKTVKRVLIAKGTVSDVLGKAGVSVGADDLISVPQNTSVTPGMNVVIQRVTYQTVTQTQPIPYSVSKTATTLLRKGMQKVTVQGKNGQLTATVRQKFIDGVLSDQQVVSQTVTTQPVTGQMLVGTALSTPVSQLDPPSSLLSLAATGKPEHFARVIHTTATGYSPKDGTTCATGRHTQVGYVAVNPDIIPMGSKLYIMSSSGSFVYGYAVAEDTGGFVSNGSGVGVDLFFSSSQQASSFGRQHVDIYVLS